MHIRQAPDCLYTLPLVQDLRLHNLGIFFFSLHHAGIPTSDHSSFMSSLAIPRNNHTSHQTIQKIKMSERNNLEHGSGKHLTLGKMTTISLSKAVGNLFRGKEKLCPEIFFCLPQLQPSVFCHLSLKKMSHADWESSGNSGIQFIFLLRPEPL